MCSESGENECDDGVRLRPEGREGRERRALAGEHDATGSRLAGRTGRHSSGAEPPPLRPGAPRCCERRRSRTHRRDPRRRAGPPAFLAAPAGEGRQHGTSGPSPIRRARARHRASLRPSTSADRREAEPMQRWNVLWNAETSRRELTNYRNAGKAFCKRVASESDAHSPDRLQPGNGRAIPHAADRASISGSNIPPRCCARNCSAVE